MPESIRLEMPGLFGSEEDRVPSERVLRVLLDALLEEDERILRARRDVPPLYESGVVYQTDPPGDEVWRSIAATLEDGHGECHDLACWRAAELRVRHGEGASVALSFTRPAPGDLLYHVTVRRGDGTIEDPSRRLGMGAEPAPRSFSGTYEGFASPSRRRRDARR